MSRQSLQEWSISHSTFTRSHIKKLHSLKGGMKKRKWRGREGQALSDCLIHHTLGSWITGNWHLTAHNRGILHRLFSSRTLINNAAERRLAVTRTSPLPNSYSWQSKASGICMCARTTSYPRRTAEIKSQMKRNAPFEMQFHGRRPVNEKHCRTIHSNFALQGYTFQTLHILEIHLSTECKPTSLAIEGFELCI